eukprot:15452444-Alexandrium_andersonii.AAC.1
MGFRPLRDFRLRTHLEPCLLLLVGRHLPRTSPHAAAARARRPLGAAQCSVPPLACRTTSARATPWSP